MKALIETRCKLVHTTSDTEKLLAAMRRHELRQLRLQPEVEIVLKATLACRNRRSEAEVKTRLREYPASMSAFRSQSMTRGDAQLKPKRRE